MSNEKDGVYDAKQLGIPKTMLLGLQHTFAMFGATVLVPILTGLSVSTTLLMTGIGTLLFHFITKKKVPVFLGSSFAFIGGYAAIAPLKNGVADPTQLAYAGGGVFVAGLVYVLIAALIKFFGAKRVMRFFPPVVTGPIIISIGLILSPTAINNCSTNWLIAFVAILIIIVCNIWGKGMIRVVPIILGVIGAYLVAVCMGEINFTAVKEAAWFGIPITSTSGFAKFNISAIVTMVPISLATIMEHIGGISAVGATTGKNYISEPGLHRTLIGDGLATTFSAFFGGPANTTYGENTGVLAISRVYDPVVMRIAACFAIVLSLSPKFAAVISSIPTAIIGGVSFILYGMISAVGVRNMVENKVDFGNSRNLIIAAVILVCALGIQYKSFYNEVGQSVIDSGISFHIGSMGITLSGLAIAAFAGIFLNAVIPGNDYEFDEN